MGLTRALAVGFMATAAMTAYQELVARLRGGGDGGGPPESWEQAPAPARVARKALRLVGVDPPLERAPLLTDVVHWSYGTGWGALYALLRPRSTPAGLGLGAGLWALSYAIMPPLKIYKPPWEYPAEELAVDLSYHLVYGGAAAAFDKAA